MLIDASIQSMATGLVGTFGSTMSLVAIRRVQDWNNGLGIMVWPIFAPGSCNEGADNFLIW